MAKRKCVFCGEYIENNDDSIPYKKRYAHQKCFQLNVKFIQEEKKKQQKEKTKTVGRKRKNKYEKVSDAVSEEEYKVKMQLYEYIKKLLDTNELPSKIYVLIDDYIKKFNYTYEGILKTIEYCFDILGKEITDDCIGLVKYYYETAQIYYEQIENLKENTQDKDIKDMYKIKTIKVSSKKNTRNLLDIESIGCDAGK